MRALGRLMLLLCFAAAMAACDHRELCYDHSHWVDLTVDFDWSEAPDARPSTMVVILFPADGSEGIRYELTRTDGPSKIRVPSGYFHAVAFNGNTESLIESGSAYDKFVITTREQDILEPMNLRRRCPEFATASRRNGGPVCQIGTRPSLGRQIGELLHHSRSTGPVDNFRPPEENRALQGGDP